MEMHNKFFSCDKKVLEMLDLSVTADVLLCELHV